jgi:hypothetical protein
MRSDEELLSITLAQVGELTAEELNRFATLAAERVKKGIERRKALEKELKARKESDAGQ